MDMMETVCMHFPWTAKETEQLLLLLLLLLHGSGFA
jgi:hypothetical protein